MVLWKKTMVLYQKLVYFDSRRKKKIVEFQNYNTLIYHEKKRRLYAKHLQ